MDTHKEPISLAAFRTPDDSPRPEWPEPIKRLAFELWSFKCGQNAEAVARHLAKGDDGVQVPARTIRDWAQTDEWATKAIDEIAALSPGIRARVITELIAGSLEAAQYLREVTRGDTDKSDKVRVTAALGLLDRVGLGPQRQITTDLAASLPARSNTSDLASLDQSPAAANTRITERRAQWRERHSS